MSEIHALDKRVTSLEEWREHLSTIDLPSINETIRKEIPRHYSGKIKESEINTMLRIESLIDKKLSNKFGWFPRILEAVAQAVIIIVALKVLGLAG